MTSVLIVDDHPIVLQGCRRVLEDAEMTPILEASDLVNGYRLYLRHQPDAVVVDLSIAGDGLGGLALIRRIKLHDPHARVLVLSMHSDPMIVARTLEAGAIGYVLKDTSSDDLVKAVESAVAGKPFISGDLAVRVAMLKSRAQQDPLSELTPRELQMLRLLADGKSYGLIAKDLNVSYKTVVNTCSQLKQKLRAETLPALISVAVKLLSKAS
ncbi:MAG: response regulator [Xanthobacteraceae bacterium]